MSLHPSLGSRTGSFRAGRIQLSCLSLTLLAAAAAAQDDPAQDDPLVLRDVPRRAPVAAPEAPSHQTPREIVAGGEVVFHPLESRDDAVPLPRASVREAGSGADRVVEPEAGDPFFLGFAAGEYRPEPGEVVDPRLKAQIQALPLQRRGADTYAFVMFSKRITDERLARLETVGARPLGFHPHHSMKVALPASAVDAVASLDFVRWIGVPRDWQKVHPLLAERLQTAGPAESLDVYVSVFESDMGPGATFEYVGEASEASPELAVPGQLPAAFRAVRWESNGWQQKALEQLGLDVVEYEDSIFAFRGRLRAADVARIRDLDFVQFVELDLPKEPVHDESMAMVNADYMRYYEDGGTHNAGLLGEVDSGVDSTHFALNHVYGWGWDLSGSGTGAWHDGNGHGSHVAGTMFADPPAGYEEMTGAAPGIGAAQDRRFFQCKVFDDSGSWGGTSLSTIFSRMHSTVTYNGFTTQRPHVVNNSWGTLGVNYLGTEADARLLDNEVYVYDQLYVFASGNEGGSGPGRVRLQAAAKNAFTVGNVVPYASGWGEAGILNPGSSYGPVGDGRWKPNVVAPGTGIESVQSNTSNSYTVKSGTSMAAPHVAGIATALVDKYSFLRYRPYTTAAVLMATAMTKDNVLISTETSTHLDTYGTGRVEAYKALWADGSQALYFWGFSQGSSGWAELPFEVLAGATRLSVVMCYHEPAASSGASQALVNDLDLWIDRPPLTSGGNTGEYFAQQSTRDNTEIRIISSPIVGSWKAKVYPRSATSTSLVGVAIVVTYGDTTPNGSFSLTSNKAYAQPNEAITFNASVYNPSYIADGVFLDTTATSGMTLLSSTVTLKDGAQASLMNNPSGGRDVMLGDIIHGQTRSAAWGARWGSEGTKTFQAELESGNMDYEVKTVNVVVDGTAPTTPGNVQATAHSPGGHYCGAQTVSMIWNASSDALAGVAGYSVQWSSSPSTIPNDSVNTTGTSWVTAVPPSSSPWYFHVKALDNAGNASSTVHVGPFHIGQASWVSYCNSNLNSTGQMATLTADGPICLATNQLSLKTVDLPANKTAYYLMSRFQDTIPFFGGSQGVLCLGAPIYRFAQFAQSTGPNGEVVFPVDMGNLPQGVVFQHGEKWNFQLWFRDKNPGQTSNTSNGIEITFD